MKFLKYSGLLIFGFLCGIGDFNAYSELTQDVQNAIYMQDIDSMIMEANKTAENEKAVIDAFCSDIDFDTYSYEQLINWQNLSKSESIKTLLSQAIDQEKIKILNSVRTLTAEEFLAYSNEYPYRKEILSQYVNDILLPNISSLTLEELMYYDDFLPSDYHDTLSDEIRSRTNEIANVLSSNFSDYNSLEKNLSERLKYIIDDMIWTYFVEGHKLLNESYAQIGIVPDNPYSAAEQYQRLVNVCFPKKTIRSTLQKEVDKFCEEINKARKEYYKVSGKNNYPKVWYKVPEIQLNSNVSVDPLREIAVARERFVRNREDISTGTSVLGWIFGGVVGLVTQGIGDWMAIDGLVSSEYTARKNYMQSVHNRLVKSFANYSNTVISGINKSLQNVKSDEKQNDKQNVKQGGKQKGKQRGKKK